MKHSLFYNDELPILRVSSQMPKEDSFLKSFAGREVEVVFVGPNHLEFRAVQLEPQKSEAVTYETMSRTDLMVECAKQGVKIDQRWGKPNIIMALREHNADASSE